MNLSASRYHRQISKVPSNRITYLTL